MMNYKSKNKLITWLKKTCKHSDNCFVDPGYSDGYKSWFAQNDSNNQFNYDYNENYENHDYHDNDNVDKLEHDDENENENDHKDANNHNHRKFKLHNRDLDIKLNPGYINGIQKDYNNIDNFVDIVKNQHILILPGTNHSNANYLYKNITECINKNTELYDIPYVDSDYSKCYMGTYKNIVMKIDKNDFYNFMFLNS